MGKMSTHGAIQTGFLQTAVTKAAWRWTFRFAQAVARRAASVTALPFPANQRVGDNIAKCIRKNAGPNRLMLVSSEETFQTSVCSAHTNCDFIVRAA